MLCKRKEVEENRHLLSWHYYLSCRIKSYHFSLTVIFEALRQTQNGEVGCTADTDRSLGVDTRRKEQEEFFEWEQW